GLVPGRPAGLGPRADGARDGHRGPRSARALPAGRPGRGAAHRGPAGRGRIAGLTLSRSSVMQPMMRLMILSALSACGAPRGTGGAAPDTAIPPREARDWFAEAHALCLADRARTWGHSLCGPMMFVDSRTRAMVASEPDREGRLRAEEGVF